MRSAFASPLYYLGLLAQLRLRLRLRLQLRLRFRLRLRLRLRAGLRFRLFDSSDATRPAPSAIGANGAPQAIARIFAADGLGSSKMLPRILHRSQGRRAGARRFRFRNRQKRPGEAAAPALATGIFPARRSL